jgi:hypothetical protein
MSCRCVHASTTHRMHEQGQSVKHLLSGHVNETYRPCSRYRLHAAVPKTRELVHAIRRDFFAQVDRLEISNKAVVFLSGKAKGDPPTLVSGALADALHCQQHASPGTHLRSFDTKSTPPEDLTSQDGSGRSWKIISDRHQPTNAVLSPGFSGSTLNHPASYTTHLHNINICS